MTSGDAAVTIGTDSRMAFTSESSRRMRRPARSPPAWVEMAIGLPATLLFTLALLPFIKGAVMGAIWVSKPELAHKG